MPHLTRQQEKAMFAGMGSRNTRDSSPTMQSRSTPILRPTERMFIASKIRKNIKEGKPRKQAIAIAFSQARKKFGSSRIPSISNQKTDKIDKRTERLLIRLLGLALALEIIRTVRN